MQRGQHLSADDRIGDLLGHPAFAGFARLMLPWDDRAPDPKMRLRHLDSLMPYHSHVKADVVLGALNHLIDDVNAGKAVFYDFYTEAQKQSDASKRHTGLFFFRGKPGAPFALIAPGGGFQYVASIHEGFPYAVQILESGCNAFVLKYRVEDGGGGATEDMAAALSYIFRNAPHLGVSTQHYSLWCGFRPITIAETGGWRSPKTVDGDHRKRTWRSPKPGMPITENGDGDRLS